MTGSRIDAAVIAGGRVIEMPTGLRYRPVFGELRQGVEVAK